jgi:diguanylate cyclase (GGDEF)-like protein/PAS domain S-box-containing protein
MRKKIRPNVSQQAILRLDCASRIIGIAALFLVLALLNRAHLPKEIAANVTVFAPGLVILAMALIAGSGIAQAMRQHAQSLSQENHDLKAANITLRTQLGTQEQIEAALTIQQQELEWSAQNLAATNALLGQASGRFQELFQGLPVSCVCYDREGKIMEWNRAFERLYDLQNVWNQSVWDTVYLPGVAPQITEAVQAVFEGERQEGIEWTHRRADGTAAQLFCSIFPLRGLAGEITGAISADIDISAQQEAEDALRHSEERMHALYNMTSQQGLTFTEKTDALLTLGREHFDLEIGVLARVNGTDYEVLQAVSPGEAIAAGTVFPVSDTYCAEALKVAQTVAFEEAGATERRNTAVYQASGVEAYLGTPVRVNGAIWGMLCFAGRQPHPRLFTSGDRELMRLMAQWIGGEIARRQAEEAVTESEERFRTAIASMSEGLIVMNSEGLITLWNSSAEQILEMTCTEMHPWRPLNPEFTAVREDGTKFPQGSYPLMQSLRRGEAQHNVVMGLPRPDNGLMWVSVNAKPLFQSGSDKPSAVVATFADITARRYYEGQIADQMAQIKEYTGVLEQQKRELEDANIQLEALALLDGLTGLGNRRAFGNRLALELGRAQRYHTPLSLLMLDVDFFKEYNDCYGHPAGDGILRQLSLTLQEEGRDTDFFARYGGEEFVVILPHTDAPGAVVLAERLRSAIETCSWPHRPITISCGAATLITTMENEEALVAAADQALYGAKAAGRNCVFHAQTFAHLSLNSTPSAPEEALMAA